MNKIALITGATSGIGRECAIALSNSGYNIIATGRREERLQALQSKLSPSVDYHYLVFDVRDKAAVDAALDSLPKPWSDIDVLINNAGNAHGLDPIQEGDPADWDAMMDINVKGLLYVSKKVMPGMIDKKAGHIVNIGSIAAKEVYPNGNVYCASKHAVDAITKGMRLDLTKYNIRVTGIHPGLVETEFSLVRFKGDEERAKHVYEGFEPLKPEDIADIVHFAVTRPAHVVMTDITVLAGKQANSNTVYKDQS
ncbi:SDR family NAD(P)-dependent oxidoreductase [Echinicola vietnamensis]|uniref:Short-chain alcohol dehydrogenase n=1 Tax=Echinicola vietnamensis (strain DSM 17526 / LMG 23754 / KMM 6221) TaxID=926556 RepID=L0FW20_ECHVK|nr:SDR family NAD(P)-dependent oxidoreductase [Echinicola vietnamensis]AGA78079.1 short-chain alcohol dehydrogenase [Echinicola vietnamensis DSM 17526]